MIENIKIKLLIVNLFLFASIVLFFSSLFNIIPLYFYNYTNIILLVTTIYIGLYIFIMHNKFKYLALVILLVSAIVFYLREVPLTIRPGIVSSYTIMFNAKAQELLINNVSDYYKIWQQRVDTQLSSDPLAYNIYNVAYNTLFTVSSKYGIIVTLLLLVSIVILSFNNSQEEYKFQKLWALFFKFQLLLFLISVIMFNLDKASLSFIAIVFLCNLYLNYNVKNTFATIVVLFYIFLAWPNYNYINYSLVRNQIEANILNLHDMSDSERMITLSRDLNNLLSVKAFEPENSKNIIMLAYIYEALLNLGVDDAKLKAIDNYERTIYLFPHNNNYRVSYANFLEYIGEHEKAMSIYDNSLLNK